MKTKNVFLLMILSILAINLSAQTEDAAVVKHEFAPLPYAYDALEKSIDKQTMEIHYDRHHRAYYTNFMKAAAGTELETKSMEQIFSEISKLPAAVRNNGGGYFNHNLFWESMSPTGGGAPKGKLAEAINKAFGSFDDFRKLFEQAAATRFGSGWAWLSVDNDGKLFVSSSPNQDNPLMDISEQRGTPLFCLDVWEHAYYLRYQNKRTSYIAAFWDVANWDGVEKRYEAAIK